MTYKAIIVKLENIRKHPNADKLNLVTIRGEQIVIGLDAKENQLGIYFPCDGQLSEEYANVNNLIGYIDPKTKQRMGGFFASNRRVRPQKFRSEKSYGFWMPIESLSFTGYDLSKLEEGMELDILNNVSICNKYITKSTIEQTKILKGLQPRREIPMFRMHIETEKFKYYVDKILAGSLLTITEKIDATSERVGYVIDDTPKWYDNLLSIIGLQRTPNWVKLVGTRKVILRGNINDDYYKSDFRYRAIETILPNLHKGEVIYGEICAWLNDNTCVQKRAGINFSYGVLKDQPKIFVYRIVQMNEDGKLVELSWSQVKNRCNELGISYVPELCEPFIYDGNSENLISLVEKHTNGFSILDPTHIREGVCIRVEGKEFSIYKNKSFEFLSLEDKSKEDENRVDLEEL